MYSLDFLIEKRKRKWNKTKSITKDREYIESVAEYIVENKLIKELQKAPSKIIELFFYIVDKHKKLTPFFLNNVQKDFVTRVDKAKEDYLNRVITSIKMLVLKGRQQGKHKYKYKLPSF